MRLTDFPLIDEVKEEYLSLRREGNNRKTSIQKLQHMYENELLQEDDSILFWIGLADAQFAYKEITSEIAERALHSLEFLEQIAWPIASQDIIRRKQQYSCAPMPEKKVFKPRMKFRCQWAIGDTYAYQIQTAIDEAPELMGKYVLFRKVADAELWDGRIIPVVTLSIWSSRPFPQTAQEFEMAPVLKLNMGKMGMQPGQVEYRSALILNSRKQLEALSLEYVGNFDVKLPENEMIYTNVAYMSMIHPQCFSRDVCAAWIKHNNYTEHDI